MRTLLNPFNEPQFRKKRQANRLRRKLKKAIEEEQIDIVKELITSTIGPVAQTNDEELDADLSLINRTITNVIDTGPISGPMTPAEARAGSAATLKRQASSESSIDLMAKQKRIKSSSYVDWSEHRRLLHIDNIGENNALHYASRLGKTCFIDMFLETNMFAIDEPNHSVRRDTALGLACEHGWLDTAKVLIARGADVNYENACGKTPLILATELVAPYDLELARMLVENGADVNQLTQGNKNETHSSTVLLSACCYDNNHLIRYLIERGAQVELASTVQQLSTPLIRCVFNNNVEMVEYMIEHAQARVDTCNSRGETPLYVAAYRGHLGLVKMLVERYGAQVDSHDRDGDTPLAVACYAGRRHVARYLLEKGANVNNRGMHGDTPLHIALANNIVASDREARQLCFGLLRYGADVNAHNHANNESVLVTACRASASLKIVRALIDRAECLDIPTADGTTPFRYLIENLVNERRLRIAIALIRAGCNVNKGFNQDYPVGAQYVDFRTLLGQDSLFDFLFAIPESYFDTIDANKRLSLTDHRQSCITLNRFIVLIQLILKSDYRLSKRDAKMFKESWLHEYLTSSKSPLVDELNHMFAMVSPKSLKDICRNEIRKTLVKPLQKSLSALCIPARLKEFLVYKY